MQNWQMRIEDPSGETRTLSLSGEKPTSLGRAPTAGLIFKDPTLPLEVATLVPRPDDPASPFWLTLSAGAPAARLGGLCVRDAALPAGMRLELGETKLTLEQKKARFELPTFPSGVRAWKTVSDSGARLLWMTKKASATPLSIYIAGETGTGKEVIAQLVHSWSERAAGPFVPLHCGALAPSLAESELFGHVKGAFTGAHQARAGALLQAHNGTLFLDEVGDLSMDLQVKLLRFLENGEIRAVGSDRLTHADVRLVCATHLPLKKLVDEGRFRRDLYYRIASVTLEIPSLRSRPEDVELLALEFAREMGKTIATSTLLRLQAHAWPGNVRELRHAVERAAGLAGAFVGVLSDESFEFLTLSESARANPEVELGQGVLTLEEMERFMILKALRICHGNRTDAAKVLGVARSTLFEMLKRHGIEGPRAHLARMKLERTRRLSALRESGARARVNS